MKRRTPPSHREKAAWMAGAKAGVEIGFELILMSIERLAKQLGVKHKSKSKRGNP